MAVYEKYEASDFIDQDSDSDFIDQDSDGDIVDDGYEAALEGMILLWHEDLGSVYLYSNYEALKRKGELARDSSGNWLSSVYRWKQCDPHDNSVHGTDYSTSLTPYKVANDLWDREDFWDLYTHVRGTNLVIVGDSASAVIDDQTFTVRATDSDGNTADMYITISLSGL